MLVLCNMKLLTLNASMGDESFKPNLLVTPVALPSGSPFKCAKSIQGHRSVSKSQRFQDHGFEWNFELHNSSSLTLQTISLPTFSTPSHPFPLSFATSTLSHMFPLSSPLPGPHPLILDPRSTILWGSGLLVTSHKCATLVGQWVVLAFCLFSGCLSCVLY